MEYGVCVAGRLGRICPEGAAFFMRTGRGQERRSMTGYLHSIESMGNVDGPGVRTVVFLQGCRLRCKYCHNPDTWPFSGGTPVQPQQIVEKLMRYKPYYGATGGVTFSGGEPLMQPAFLCECLRLCRQAGIHTCIDTAGVGLGEYDEILRWTDLVLLDVKHEDPQEYKALTGGEPAQVQAFIQAVRRAGTPMWVRHVVVPGLTDGAAHMRKLAEYVKRLPNVQRVQLLAYHTMGIKKYDALGIPYPLKGTPPMDAQACGQYEKEWFAAYAEDEKGEKNG